MKTCLMWTQTYADTLTGTDKIFSMDKILSIYPLIQGQNCHVWTVDTKRCTTKQNYLYLFGNLAVTLGGGGGVVVMN